MSLRLTVRETFERHLGSLSAPSVDLDEIRKAGIRPRRMRLLAMALATAAVVACVALVVAVTQRPPAPTPEQTELPVLNFAGGARGFVSDDEIYLGGEHFDRALVKDLSSAAVPTLYGVVFFSDDQAVRMLSQDGSVSTLAAAPAHPAEFTPSVVFDASRPALAWVTRSAKGVSVSVYGLSGSARLIGSYPVPCSGDACQDVQVVGLDFGHVFLDTPSGSLVLTPADGPRARWRPVADAPVLDVRNRVVLLQGQGRMALRGDSGLDRQWRAAAAATETSRLTFEGARQTDGTLSLRPTQTRVAPLPLAVPSAEGTEVTLDSDGSAFIGQPEGDGVRYWDCDPAGICYQVGFVEGKTKPEFLGQRR